jgi:hypothetical protein
MWLNDLQYISHKIERFNFLSSSLIRIYFLRGFDKKRADGVSIGPSSNNGKSKLESILGGITASPLPFRQSHF